MGKSKVPDARVGSFPFIITTNIHYGFDMNPEEYRQINIRNGLVENCSYFRFTDKITLDNRREAYRKAKTKILLFGSSFTATHVKKNVSGKNQDVYIDYYAEEFISSSLGRSVEILNLSRGSFGILQMFDLAKQIVPEYKPDLIIFAPNTTDISRPRWWPIFRPDTELGNYRYYQSRTFAPRSLTREFAVLQPIVVTKALTSELCREINDKISQQGAFRAGEHPATKRFMIAQKKLTARQKMLTLDIDFWILGRSFVWNALRHGSPFFDIHAFADNNPVRPIPITDLRDDKEFVDVFGTVKGFGIPMLFVHIPTYQDLISDHEYAFGYNGVAAAHNKSLHSSLELMTGRPMVSLKSYLPAGTKVLSMVRSSQNSHPSEEGTIAYGKALGKIISAFMNNEPVIRKTAKDAPFK